MILNSILLMTPQSGGSGSGWSTIVMMLLLVVIFWLFFIRPQSKKNKELANFRNNLKKGDRIITIGGIHGKILEVNETTLVIETEGQGRLRIEKVAVQMEFNPDKITENK